MKKTFLLASLILTFGLAKAQVAIPSTATPAHSPEKSKGKKENHNITPEQKADKFVVKMTEAIGLEEAQKSKVKSLALDHFKAMETLKKQANADKEKIKAEVKTSRKKFNDGLKKVLSPKQFEAWKTSKKEAATKKKGASSKEPIETIED